MQLFHQAGVESVAKDNTMKSLKIVGNILKARIYKKNLI